MVEEKVYSRTEALKKGYLENKKVYLKPIPSRGGNMIKDPAHIGYFMWEGAKKSYVLNIDSYGILISPFKDEEEAHYFSKLLDIDLNHRKKTDNFWHTFEVSVYKTPEFMYKGIEYDLSDPMDNIRYRVLKQQEEVAKSWDERFESPKYKFALVDQDYDRDSQNEEMGKMEAIFTHWGTIKHSEKKMREFLGTYLMEKKINKIVTANEGEKFLTSEIQKIIKNDSDAVYKLINDKDAPVKYKIFNLIQIGAIRRKGVATYNIIGMEDKDLSYKDLVKELKFLEQTTDPLYLKMEAQLEEKLNND